MQISLFSQPGWGKPFIIVVVSLLFLMMGVDMMIAAYRVENPLYFIMTFFSSSLMILISITGLIFSAVRIHDFFKGKSYQP